MHQQEQHQRTTSLWQVTDITLSLKKEIQRETPNRYVISIGSALHYPLKSPKFPSSVLIDTVWGEWGPAQFENECGTNITNVLKLISLTKNRLPTDFNVCISKRTGKMRRLFWNVDAYCFRNSFLRKRRFTMLILEFFSFLSFWGQNVNKK